MHECAECKRGGDVVPFGLYTNAKGELVVRHLHVGCFEKWIPKYHAWRDGLTSNGSTSSESITARGESGTSETSPRQSRET